MQANGRRLASILHRYSFAKLRPGENDKDFKFEGPGLVLICEEIGLTNSVFGTMEYDVLHAMSANEDALEAAKRALSQPQDSDRYRFAMLAQIPDVNERASVAAEIEALCSSGK